MSAREPFPAPLQARQHLEMADPSSPIKTRRRKLSNHNLPGEPRGDTGVAAMATMTGLQENANDAAETAKRYANEKALRPHSKRRKAKTIFRRWKSISLRHTWLNPLILVLTILSIYAYNPVESNPLHSAIFLSYPRPNGSPGQPVQYGKGARDLAFVAFYTIVLSFTREFLMQRFLRPLAISYGMKSRAKQSRFMEQGYTAIYFAIFGPFGLYVMSRSPVWYFNTKGMYENFPHREHEGMFKAYYLLQAAYWGQQALVLLLQLEAPRKDFKELVGHHIITLSLIWCSYRFHFAYMGLAVYITHDISDFFLASSKCLNYISSPITEPYFGLFVVIWAYLRHYLNLRILYAVLTDFRTVGPFVLDWDTEQYKCWISQYITFGLLASLQAVNIFWFGLILRIAKRYVMDNVEMEDDRSDYGGEEDVTVAGASAAGAGETTEEKRNRMAAVTVKGPKANGHAVAAAPGNGVGAEPTAPAAPAAVHVNGNAPNGTQTTTTRSTPKVLLNGLPVDEDAAIASSPKPAKGRKKGGIVVSATEKKSRAR